MSSGRRELGPASSSGAPACTVPLAGELGRHELDCHYEVQRRRPPRAEQGSAGDEVNPHVEEKRSGGSGELAAHAEEEVLANGT